ncbi:MAG: HTH-type transcriptional regulator CymR [Fibrobacterota bacterium]|jgi:Rrf2 family cysteine metabolism transcriptional repressor
MRVTTKTIYALQLLLALAERARVSKSPIQLREIAEAYNLPFKFLEQIAISLKSAGWIHGQRGKDGGYVLSVAANKLSMGEVIRLLEGESSALRIQPGTPEEEAIEGVLTRCRVVIDQIVNETTLDALLNDVHLRKPTGNFDYAI